VGNASTVTNGVYTSNKLSVLSSTTSSELAGVISDATGTGSLVFATSPTLTQPKFVNNGYIADTNGNELIVFGSPITLAVNEIKITNAATGIAPIIEAYGGDTNIDLNLNAKGTGSVVIAKADINGGTIDGTTGATIGATTGAGGATTGATDLRVFDLTFRVFLTLTGAGGGGTITGATRGIAPQKVSYLVDGITFIRMMSIAPIVVFNFFDDDTLRSIKGGFGKSSPVLLNVFGDVHIIQARLLLRFHNQNCPCSSSIQKSLN
jgi:hypothetical protein